MLNIVIPMAGHGSRFSSACYPDPKPLIKIGQRTMIELVVTNLRPTQPHRFIFICQQAHIDRYGLGRHLSEIAPNCVVIPIAKVTQGAACTVLMAKDFIDSTTPLMIANCDQYVEIAIDDYLLHMQTKSLDGLIMTMTADDAKWSFVRLDTNDCITEVVEKVVVSNEATVGIYNYARGCDFVAAVDSMLSKQLRVNGEYYVAPAYNEMIITGSKLGYHNIGAVGSGMWGLGTPEDLAFFLSRNPEKT